MIDLKLNETDTTTSFSEEELVDAIHAYYEASEELSSAEQELMEINRACENLEAIKAAVKKYGWNDIINDLFGDQLSCESIDSSCESAFDKIKKVAGKVANKFKAMIANLTNIFRIHAAMFKDAAKYFKNKPNSTTSTEAATPQSETLYIDLADLGRLMDDNKVEQLIDQNKSQLGRIDTEFMQQYILKNCKSIELSSLSNTELSGVLENAGRMLERQKEEHIRSRMTDEHRMENDSLKSLRASYRKLDAIEYDQDNPEYTSDTRRTLASKSKQTQKDIKHYAYWRAYHCAWRVLYNRTVVSIRQLKSEITKRGYSSSR